MSRFQVVHLCRGRDWRGGERQVRLLARMLARRADLTQLVATGRDSRLAAALREDGLLVAPLPWRLAYDPRAGVSLVRQLRALASGPKRLLLHAHDSHALALALFASRLLALPLVATRRSVAAPGPLWRYPDRVIAISGAVARALAERGVPDARVCRVASAIDLAALRTVVPRSGPEPPYLIAVGAFTPEKGHATLIDALALLAPPHAATRLLLVGDGSGRAALEARAAQRGVASRIEFTGELASAAPCIAGARMLIQPSFQEALGTAVLEAMALGIPVVASHTGGLPELVGDGAGLLVPPGDPVALAEAITRMLGSPALRASVARAAAARATEFDAPGMADRVVEVYRSALGDT